MHGKQRRFHVYVTISCSGPDAAATRINGFGTRRSRDGADLRFTTADCDWWHRHFKQPHYDSSEFEQHHRLVNPSRAQILEAVAEGGEYLSAHQGRPEWDGGSMNFVYAGHGDPGTGSWVCHDGVISGVELADAVARSVIPNPRRCRIDLIMDSCFSGAFFADLLGHSWGPQADRLFPCAAFGAALSDELAWEFEEQGHGAFTYAFQKQFRSTKNISEQPAEPDLRNGLVRLMTDGEQNVFEYENGNLEVLGAGHVDFSTYDSLTSSQVRAAMCAARDQRRPRQAI